MPGESKYDSDKLRALVEQGKNANEIADEFGVNKAALKTYLFKLMNEDKKFYDVPGFRSYNRQLKVGKNGLLLSKERMENYGFEIDDRVEIEKVGGGELLIKKAR